MAKVFCEKCGRRLTVKRERDTFDPYTGEVKKRKTRRICPVIRNPVLWLFDGHSSGHTHDISFEEV